jgi:hypothetical protein
MEIQYSVTESDVLALARFRLQKMPSIRRRMRIRRFGYSVGFAALALGLWLVYGDITIPLIFFLSPFYADWRLNSAIARQYQDAKARGILETTLRATPDGLEQSTILGDSKAKWESIDDVVITPMHTFMSIVSQGWSLVIPEKVVTGNYQQFVATCRTYKQQASESETK